MKILVTGATGFLGIPLCETAIKYGHFVRALVRPSSQGHPLIASEVVYGDLRDPSTLYSAVKGVDGVVHAGAVTSESSSSYNEFYKTNVVGTSNLIEACHSNGVRRFIAISSLSAKEENTGFYGITKLQAEKLILASKLEYTILRPAFIYGPGERGLFKKMVNLIQLLPVVPIIGSGKQLLRPVYVYDVASAVLTCISSSQTIFKVYEFGGESNITYNEFIGAILDCLDRKTFLIHIPVGVLMLIASILQRVLKTPPITRDNVIGIVQSAEIDNTVVEKELEFKPTPLRDGLERSLNPDKFKLNLECV